MRDKRAPDLPGAAPATISDLVRASTTVAGDVSGAATLVVLPTATEPPVTELARRVGLSQPAADQMQADAQFGAAVPAARPRLRRRRRPDLPDRTGPAAQRGDQPWVS